MFTRTPPGADRLALLPDGRARPLSATDLRVRDELAAMVPRDATVDVDLFALARRLFGPTSLAAPVAIAAWHLHYAGALERPQPAEDDRDHDRITYRIRLTPNGAHTMRTTARPARTTATAVHSAAAAAYRAGLRDVAVPPTPQPGERPWVATFRRAGIARIVFGAWTPDGAGQATKPAALTASAASPAPPRRAAPPPPKPPGPNDPFDRQHPTVQAAIELIQGEWQAPGRDEVDKLVRYTEQTRPGINAVSEVQPALAAAHAWVAAEAERRKAAEAAAEDRRYEEQEEAGVRLAARLLAQGDNAWEVHELLVNGDSLSGVRFFPDAAWEIVDRAQRKAAAAKVRRR